MQQPRRIQSTPAKTRTGCLDSRGVWICLLSLLAVVGLVSCATKQSQPPASRPGGGLAEYREIVIFAMKAMRNSQDALEQLTVHPDRKSFDAFSESVNQIAVDSIQVRARSKAMEARGDAYFEQWRERLARMNDGPSRQLAEEHRAELKESCDHIFQTARETRPTFNSFLSGLREIRAKLETNPDYHSIDSARTLIASTQKSGHQVNEGLSEMLAELNSLSARLAASNTTSLKQP